MLRKKVLPLVLILGTSIIIIRLYHQIFFLGLLCKGSNWNELCCDLPLLGSGKGRLWLVVLLSESPLLMADTVNAALYLSSPCTQSAWATLAVLGPLPTPAGIPDFLCSPVL